MERIIDCFVDDVDEHHARAEAAGANILEEQHETEYGENQYAAKDLDGDHWLFSQHVKDCSPEEWELSREAIAAPGTSPCSPVNWL